MQRLGGVIESSQPTYVNQTQSLHSCPRLRQSHIHGHTVICGVLYPNLIKVIQFRRLIYILYTHTHILFFFIVCVCLCVCFICVKGCPYKVSSLVHGCLVGQTNWSIVQHMERKRGETEGGKQKGHKDDITGGK